MYDDNNTPLAYQFRLRMHELMGMALEDGTLEGEDWDPDTLGFSVFGGDPLLQQNPALVADIVGYELGGSGATVADLAGIVQGMKTRMYDDEFNRDWGVEAQSEGGSNE